MKTDFLKGLGLEQEVINQIMAEHGKTINKEKEKMEAKLSDYNEKTIALNEASNELNKLRGQVNEVEAWKTKYEESLAANDTLKSEFEQFKTESESKYTSLESEVQNNILWETGKDMLEKEGFSPVGLKHLKDKILPHLREGGYQDGKFSNWDTVSSSLKDQFPEFYTTIEEKGAPVPNPPIKQPGNEDSFLKGLKGN